MKIAVLSNVNLDFLIKTLSKKHEVYQTEGYGQWASYALSQNKEFAEFSPEIIFILIDGNALTETINSYNDGVKEITQSINIIKSMSQQYPNSQIAVSTIDIQKKRINSAANIGFESLLENYWQEILTELINSSINILPLDLKGLIVNEGRKNFYADNMWYMGSIPYGIKAITKLSEYIDSFTEHYSQTRKKVLICDLDNTLWGGVVGEDGPKGIKLGESLLGAVYRDTQKRIKEIADTGILLAIVSKNNQEDVDTVFANNPYMYLKKEDFVSIKCNWQSKSENIQNLAKELNLGLDSFVFLDDNPVEREEVKLRLPNVCVADFPKDVANLPKTIENIFYHYFWCKKLTTEDLIKTEQYRQEELRKQDLAKATSLEDYLLSLNISIRLGEAETDQFDRIVQLLNKTNQFNTNTHRFNQQEFLEYQADNNNHVYVANVSDKYGDNGLVVILMVHCNCNEAIIDNFLMSCRVMGRQIENAVITAVENRLYEIGIKTLHASYIKTAKNKPVEKLYDKLGFKLIDSNNNNKKYCLSLPYCNNSLLKVEWV